MPARDEHDPLAHPLDLDHVVAGDEQRGTFLGAQPLQTRSARGNATSGSSEAVGSSSTSSFAVVQRRLHDADERALTRRELVAHRRAEMRHVEPLEPEVDRRSRVVDAVELAEEVQELAHAQPFRERQVARPANPTCSMASLRQLGSGCPHTSTRPASGVITPSSIMSVVVLPAPFGPSNATRSPDGHVEVDMVDGADALVLLLDPFGAQDESQACARVSQTGFRRPPG